MPNLSASVSKQKFNELAKMKMVHAIEPQESEPEDSIKDQDNE